MKYVVALVLTIYTVVLYGQQETNTVTELVLNEQIDVSIDVVHDFSPGIKIAQLGNDNEATADISSGASFSSLNISQIGNSNSFSISGNSTNSSLNMLQQGNVNTMHLSLLDDVESRLNYIQYGSGNSLSHQLHQSYGTEMTLIQDGTNHELQIDAASMEISGMRITQTGNAARLIIRE